MGNDGLMYVIPTRLSARFGTKLRFCECALLAIYFIFLFRKVGFDHRAMTKWSGFSSHSVSSLKSPSPSAVSLETGVNTRERGFQVHLQSHVQSVALYSSGQTTFSATTERVVNPVSLL